MFATECAAMAIAVLRAVGGLSVQAPVALLSVAAIFSLVVSHFEFRARH